MLNLVQKSLAHELCKLNGYNLLTDSLRSKRSLFRTVRRIFALAFLPFFCPCPNFRAASKREKRFQRAEKPTETLVTQAISQTFYCLKVV